MECQDRINSIKTAIYTLRYLAQKGMKKLILILLGFIVLGCENQTTPIDLSSQITFLKGKITTLSKDMKNKVEETGISPAGSEFIKINE